TDLAELVAALTDQVSFGGRTGFTFFGHSLGSLVAYEVTRALRARGRPLPDRLVVSGFRAPSQPRTVQPVHHLSDDELLAAVHRRHGGFPAEAMADPELRRMLAGYLRADYQLLETYRWQPGEPLPVPISAFGGRDDRVTAADLRAWQR